ncbi:hypothetical protein [Cerasicoccus maritimus]|uniref:hypothetical protein n=1 Tax=Cerasicoccus maritimus TaxID=490089 RepID=UPI00285294D3|nr:hypothetical protein [Cerasicoccus maritimus]
MNEELELAELTTADASPRQCRVCQQEIQFDAACWQACREYSAVFFKSLQFGRVRGIVTLAACQESDPAQTAALVEMTQELLKRDILVAVSGCTAEAFDAIGMMGEGAFDYAGEGLAEVCDFIGITPVIRMGGSVDHADVMEFYYLLAKHVGASLKDLPLAALATNAVQENNALLNQLQGIYGSVARLSGDAMASADRLDELVHEKRLSLGWSDRYHCSMETYS